MRLLDRHLLQAAAGPFLFGLATFTFLLMIDNLYRYVDMFISKGVPFLMATEVLFLSLGHTLALSIPMSVLFAVLMGVGQLAGDNEITAMKASGISLWKILRPLLAGATIICAGMIAFNHYIYPESNHRLVNRTQEIRHSRPMLEIRAQMFTDISDDMTIYVATKDDLSGRITDIEIIEKEKPGEPGPRVTVARDGRIITDRATGAMKLVLYDGETHEMPDPNDPDRYQVTRFGQHDRLMLGLRRDIEDSKRQTRGDRELNLTALKEASRSHLDRLQESRQHVANLNADMVNWQYRLLDADQRRESGLQQAANPAERGSRLSATRRRLDQTAGQIRAQSSVADQHLRRSQRLMVEYHKKLAIPVACIVFTLLGIPMAIGSRRGGKDVSIGLAMGVFLVYFLCLTQGEKLSDRGMLHPIPAMWTGNALLLAVGLPFFHRTARETAGRPWRLPAPWRRLRRARVS